MSITRCEGVIKQVYVNGRLSPFQGDDGSSSLPTCSKKIMNKNSLLYNAAAALTECAKFVRPVDVDFVQVMLDKAKEFADQIIIDEQLEKEVKQFEKRIREGLTK